MCEWEDGFLSCADNFLSYAELLFFHVGVIFSFMCGIADAFLSVFSFVRGAFLLHYNVRDFSFTCSSMKYLMSN